MYFPSGFLYVFDTDLAQIYSVQQEMEIIPCPCPSLPPYYFEVRLVALLEFH
jgi:hypothetical protein